MYRVLKLNGSVEPFQPEKLRRSIERAAQDAGVEVDGAADIKVERDVGSWELADLVHVELLKKAIERPELAEVAKSHLLGRIYKEIFGRDFLRVKSDEEYQRRALAAFEKLAGVIKPEALELLRQLKLRPEFDRSLSYNALRLFTNGNYALRRLDFQLAETPSMAAARVATAVARDVERARLYYDYITSLKLIPASPYWFNAWTSKEMFASCFILMIEDCLSSITHPGKRCIYDVLTRSGLIQQAGGGVGYDFSLLRPEGDVVRGSAGVASGPISFMKLFDANVEVIKQGGKRRGAQMGTLHVWHPDIRKFIKAKTGELKDVHLQNFNISVVVDDAFMEKALDVDKDPNYPLVNPRIVVEKLGIKPIEVLELTREVQLPKDATVGSVNAKELFREIVEGAWDSGDPGLIFKSNMNASNSLLYVNVDGDRYVWFGTNPCAEVPGADKDVCNLTHINLVKFVKEGCSGRTLEEKLECIDWAGLAETARVGVRFLDDAVDISTTGMKDVDETYRKIRKIGLGVMGLAEMLIKLEIPYASWDAVTLVNRVLAWIYLNALDESAELARERGPFKYFHQSDYARGVIPVLKYQDFVWSRWERVRAAYPPEYRELGDRLKAITYETRRWLDAMAKRFGKPTLAELSEKVKGGVRNSVVMSVAPTGRTSILAGTTSGVEPVFALAFLRNVTVGTLVEYYWPGVEYLRARGLWTPEVRRAVEESGMLRDAPVPEDVKHLLATAMEIHWAWHVLMQASAQQWVDQGISKTINMPANATKDDVYWAFALAWALGVKGITVYRDKSKSVQVIYTGIKQEIKKKLADTKIVVKPLSLDATISDAAEQVKLKALEEGKDPYCKTGECG
ncbi:adenosylcobalamin-dependent ribonucleoside-diphosphate reductase [Pyrobaculum calidifontis]|uniref:Vitamin B12-dependent ribonucleotide reductase n=1 Tax=Pyrobaculum calidifontis (strain DSM 21063 / JCM 11548 / VA1) TaxID=410359 RepID=A3MX47_PYRCJ|nr:adenosylcobalamin-dependent ribonucleoside-diphosphate reductase [Pyrobaculum calidifontis]ABO09214.1 ribonucleoside-diphosphate reductase, adenosylcobalamin-dependent [Pyrobaculum calidifontis JCM 11548]